ncbi:ShiF [Klebsiella pneumoniae]|uniref:ShiF n=1 Tax=Klebsiella pneumoniae TaxID=573 RepID=A0A2X3C1M0_KLEPN|nr:ShiF [Klebsiella pneumoniae]
MMQLGLSPALTRQFATDTAAISHHVAWLLGLAAVAALIAQFGVLRPQRLTPMALLLSAGALMICGLAIMFAEQLWLFYLGCAVLSFGAALATPAYQLLLNDKLNRRHGCGLDCYQSYAWLWALCIAGAAGVEKWCRRCGADYSGFFRCCFIYHKYLFSSGSI